MTNTQAEPHSFEVCTEAELFPKKNPVCDDEGLVVPFPTLHGESVEYLGRVSDGVIALSNYRLLIRAKKWFVNIPLGLIDGVDTREIFYIVISCKDATTIRCSFPTNDWCQVWYKRLVEKTSCLKDLNQCFALSYHAWCMDDNASGSQSSASQTSHSLCQITDEVLLYKFGNEIKRMKFDTSNNKVWRMSYINEDFKICPSYPNIHIVPTSVSDDDLHSVASFRSMRRFPSVVWRSQKNGAVIVRCSQPELGWLGWRNTEDENLLSAIPLACSQDPGTENKPESGQTTPDQNGEVAVPIVSQKKMLLIDCRSYGAAFANRAKGGGCESADYYPCCEIQFMNLANIHTIRKSFIALRTLTSTFTEQANWLSSLENTKWLHYIGAILRAANLVVSAVDQEARPVLVHCSDGWDRTPQIVALAQLLLDPYYRKIEGFQVLVEREWFEFGHKFADRCGHSLDSEDGNERSPVFLQWLDCVYQVYKQFPCAFEFNEAYLVKLVHHTYSRLFGNFLFNTNRERVKENLSKRTTSVWTLLHPRNTKFHNLLYNNKENSESQQILYPDFSMNNLSLWRSVYLSNSSLSTNTTEDISNPLETGEITPDIESMCLQKTRSCENLAKLQDHAPLVTRRLSDPNILHGSQEQIVAACKDLDSSPKHVENESSCVNDQAIISNGVVTNGVNGIDSDKENSDSEENTVTVSDSNDNIVNEIQENGDGKGKEVEKEAQDEIADEAQEEEEEIKDEGEGVINEDEPVDELCRNTTNFNGHSNHQLTNGHATLKEIQAKNLVNGHSDSSLRDRKPLQKSVESSTDTITGDEYFERKLDDNVPNGVTNGLSNGHTNGYSNGHAMYDEIGKLADSHQYLIKTNSSRPISSMSTSTSDISDSHVGSSKSEWDSKVSDLKLSSQCFGSNRPPYKLNCSAGYPYSKPNINSASPSPSSSSPYPTPFYSRTPNSTCPPTPEIQSKSCDWQINRQLNGVGRHLDCDGLTTFIDPIQQRMQQKEADYKKVIEDLRMKVCSLQKQLCCNGIQRLDNRDDLMALPEDYDGDHCSLGNISNPASDVSWENLDYKESPMIMWIPDHAVTHCACCQSQFWTAKRKHHCRSCGKIYCADCSNYFAPVPHQHLKESVRVCQSCHDLLQPQFPDIIDDRQPQMIIE
ncbi:myotubularin-related protein 3 [Patella vulgata]|uniref:myotubularin-related protein 3 n=1 Tax=Patella vulgata TaxID=6465 RepID=UPI0024A805BB|nr:myotubularin-related protein 3 [Patella vulgata]